MPRHRFTNDERRRGGTKAAGGPGGRCEECGLDFATHAAYAGHLGLHGFANHWTGGDIAAARDLLSQSGAASMDPFPGNGAFSRGHKMLRLFRERG